MSLNTENAILSNAIKVDSSYNVGIGVNPSFPLDLLTNSSGTFNTITQIYNSNFTSGNRSYLRIRQQLNAGASSSSYFGTGQDGNLYIISNDSARGGDLIINSTTGGATFVSSVTAGGLITGQSGIYQTNASSVVASNRFETFNGGATQMQFLYPASGSVGWNNGSDRMVLTSGGHVGVKVVPNSGWGSVMSALQIGTGGVLSNWTGGNNNFAVGVNYYDNGAGSLLRLYSGGTSKIEYSEDTIIFANAGSNGAGTSISFTERMRITSGGNVGIGTSSPARKLDVNGVTRSNAYDIFYNSVTAGFLLTETQWTGVAGVNNVSLVAEGGVSGGGAISFFTNGSASERLKITASGSLNFNASNSTGGVYIVVNRKTNVDGGFLLTRDSTTNDWQVVNDNGGNYTMYSYGIGGNAFVISKGTGNATLWGSLTQNASDKRLKDNIKNIPNALDKISKINGVSFTWNNEIYKTDRTNDIGVIAQEIKEVLPEAVTLAPFDNDGEGNSKSGDNYLTVYYEKIIPLLIEGIKEQQAQIEAQQEQINLLINK